MMMYLQMEPSNVVSPKSMMSTMLGWLMSLTARLR